MSLVVGIFFFCEFKLFIGPFQVMQKGLTVTCMANVSSVYSNASTLRYPASPASLPSDAVSASMASSRHGKDSSFSSSKGTSSAAT